MQVGDARRGAWWHARVDGGRLVGSPVICEAGALEEVVAKALDAGEPVVSFAGQGPDGKNLSADSLFGDIDLGSNPAIKVPTEAEPEAALSGANVEQECRSMLAHGHFEQAREGLAAALRKEPRNRRLRALYHVANGRVLQSKDEAVQATAQFEAALAHDRECAEAKQAIDDMHKAGSRKGGLFGRIFK